VAGPNRAPSAGGSVSGPRDAAGAGRANPALSASAEPYRQSRSTVRFEWGLPGAVAIGEGAGVIVVVDVLSFSTTVSVAVDAGISVYPYRFRDASAAAFAASKGAVLAVGRREAGSSGVSLSPLSIRQAAPGGPLARAGKLVLPSPNGSAICRALGGAVPVVAACFRNAPAVARWIRRTVGSAPIAVVAAGERWPGDLLRPAVEDLWGAGAVIAALADAGVTGLSPEAAAAAAAFRPVLANLRASLAECASGRELAADGFGAEIAVAAEFGASSAVPLLVGDAFRAG
jgi:2-phosphosulfolactate phosphatase